MGISMVDLFRNWRARRNTRRAASGGAMVFLLALAAPAQADEIAYGYDALGRLTSVSVGGATAYYDYDAAGNIIGIRRPVMVSSVPSARGAIPSLAADSQVAPSVLASGSTGSR
jgi:RHS Repeat.